MPINILAYKEAVVISPHANIRRSVMSHVLGGLVNISEVICGEIDFVFPGQYMPQNAANKLTVHNPNHATYAIYPLFAAIAAESYGDSILPDVSTRLCMPSTIRIPEDTDFVPILNAIQESPNRLLTAVVLYSGTRGVLTI